MKRLLLFGCLVMGSISAFAGGSQVSLQSIKLQAMGHAGTAISLDGSAMFFNPGAFVFGPNRYEITLGANGIFAQTHYRAVNSNYTSQTQNDMSTPFNFYAGASLNDYVKVGLGVYNPFGSAVKWEDNWKGRYLIQEVSLRSFYIQPTISFKVNDWMGIGFGYVHALGDVYLEKDIPVNTSDGKRYYASLTGDAQSQGFNAGIYLKPFKHISIGATYRSGVNFELENGEALFVRPEFLEDEIPKENSFDGFLPLPSTYAFSVAYEKDRWLLALEYDLTQWEVYDTLRIDFEKNTDLVEDIADPKLYENAFQIRVGLQYLLSSKFTLRAGYVYDRTPIQENYYSPETPDMNRSALTCGGSIHLTPSIDVDLSYSYVRGQEYTTSYRPENFSGTYQTVANVFSFGFSFGIE